MKFSRKIKRSKRSAAVCLLLLSGWLLGLLPACQPESKIIVSSGDYTSDSIRGAMITTHYQSLDDLKRHVRIDYFNEGRSPQSLFFKPGVRLVHQSGGQQVSTELQAGVSEDDFKAARDGDWWDKIQLLFRSPYFVRNREDLLRVYVLARRDHKTFSEGDPAFYDLAEEMMKHIHSMDRIKLDSMDLGEKGYFNTINHINAQVFMTVLFSEELADFVADAHERTNLSALVTGEFSKEELDDLADGPVDNYVDMINNEWGQELGKMLKNKYEINRSTKWSPELLADFLNDVQAYFGWAFQLGFWPFIPEDERVVKFSKKLNRVMKSATHP